MAALLRHGIFKNAKIKPTINVFSSAFATKAEKKKGLDRKLTPRIDATAASISAKGFLRSQRAYSPPGDVNIKIEAVCKRVLGDFDSQTRFGGDLKVKFDLIAACSAELDHSVPNSLLHQIETVGDLKKFFDTSVITTTPLEKMRNMDLPENLHVQFDYHRFHPDTDTKFKGQTAFNRSSTLVTGLKYKGKYPGHKQNQQWPYNS